MGGIVATAIVSGRVDEAVKERAGAYIKAAGLTVGDVINIVWTNIANTKQVPTATEQDAEPLSAWDAFMQFRATRLQAGNTSPIPDMTLDEIHDMIATDMLEEYEAL